MDNFLFISVLKIHNVKQYNSSIKYNVKLIVSNVFDVLKLVVVVLHFLLRHIVIYNIKYDIYIVCWLF